MKPCKGEELMKEDFFDALEEVYTQGGVGNAFMCQFYEYSIAGGSESNLQDLLYIWSGNTELHVQSKYKQSMYMSF